MLCTRTYFSRASRLFALVAICALAGSAHGATTLQNLEAAFNAETNAQLRYLGFAQRADSEGYGEVASLFRAIARSEQIDAANHAEVIKEMGGTPQAQMEVLTIRSTRENLEAALKRASHEHDAVYPGAVNQAKADANTRAFRSLNYAMVAEAEHIKLFADVLSHLEHLQGTSHAIFYVCPTCGLTVRETNFEKCPSCFTSREAFEVVS